MQKYVCNKSYFFSKNVNQGLYVIYVFFIMNKIIFFIDDTIGERLTQSIRIFLIRNMRVLSRLGGRL